jgi:hypothetical protein
VSPAPDAGQVGKCPRGFIDRPLNRHGNVGRAWLTAVVTEGVDAFRGLFLGVVLALPFWILLTVLLAGLVGG